MRAAMQGYGGSSKVIGTRVRRGDGAGRFESADADKRLRRTLLQWKRPRDDKQCALPTWLYMCGGVLVLGLGEVYLSVGTAMCVKAD